MCWTFNCYKSIILRSNCLTIILCFRAYTLVLGTRHLWPGGCGGVGVLVQICRPPQSRWKNSRPSQIYDKDVRDPPNTPQLFLSCFKWGVINIAVYHLPRLYSGPRQANLVLIAYASSEGSGEPAHPRSLARTSAARSYKQWVKRNLQTESQIPGPSEWLGMRS